MIRKGPDKKRILFIFASRKNWAGGEQYIYDIIQNLPEEHYTPYILTARNINYGYKLRELVPEEHIFSLTLKTAADIVSIWNIRNIIIREDIDIVHAHLFSDSFMAIFARALCDRDDIAVIMTRHLVRKAKTGFMHQYLYGKLDKLIFVSHLAASKFISSSPRIDKANITVIPNSIAELKTAPVVSRDDNGMVEIAYAGRLAEEKGLDVLLLALSHIREHNFRLRMAGIGSEEYMAKLKGEVAEYGLGDKVGFIGFLDDVASFVASADIGILVSTCQEASGLTLLEYMRAGLAIVTTNNGAQPEFLTDGMDAMFVDPGDAEGLFGTISKLIDDPEERERLGNNARETFREKLSYPRFLKKLISVYEEFTWSA